MIHVPKRLPLGVLVAAFILTVVFVPFRHRTLATGPDGGFTFLDERVWAPLWRQPTFASGVAEYPFRVLLVEWAALAAAAALVAAWRRRPRGGPGPRP